MRRGAAAGCLAQAATMGVTALALFAAAPVGVVFALAPQPLIDAVTGHPASAGVAARLVRERLQSPAST